MEEKFSFHAAEKVIDVSIGIRAAISQITARHYLKMVVFLKKVGSLWLMG